MAKIICISDTHCQLEKVKIPDGDILIHSGDLTFQGTESEIAIELNKLANIKHDKKLKHVVLIAGNHDFLPEKNFNLMNQMCKDNGVIYLQDSGVELEGIKFYGSPSSNFFFDWAFNYYEPDLYKLYQKIPLDTNVLLTHGPCRGILDMTVRGEEVGSISLRKRVFELPELKLHNAGHIHSSRGHLKLKNIDFVNSSICNEKYQPINLPLVISI